MRVTQAVESVTDANDGPPEGNEKKSCLDVFPRELLGLNSSSCMTDDPVKYSDEKRHYLKSVYCLEASGFIHVIQQLQPEAEC